MKKAVRCISFVLVLSFVVAGVYHVLSWKDAIDDYSSTPQMLYNTDKNLIDAVFLGSSHTYCSIYPAIMWEQYGISAFNMAVSGQDKHSTYHDLKEVLKTQSPTVVVTDIYGLLFDRNHVEGNVFRNMLSLKTSVNSIQKVCDYIGEPEDPKNSVQIPKDELTYILRWPIVHTRYSELQKYDFIENPVNTYSRGGIYSWYITPDIGTPDNTNIKDLAELTRDDKKWIDDMAALSQKEGFTLIFYFAPYILSEEEQKTLNAVTKYAVETYGIQTYDINKIYKEIDFDYNHDMNDAGHANGYGAVKITSWFGNMLSEEFDLVNHTGDSKYYQWDKDYKLYEHSIISSALYGNIDIFEYIKTAQTDGYIVFLSLDGEFKDLIPYLENVGLTEEEMVIGRRFMYKDGAWTKMSDNYEGSTATYEATAYDVFTFQYDPNNAGGSMLYKNQTLIGTCNGMNVAVYDDFLKELVNTRYLDN